MADAQEMLESATAEERDELMVRLGVANEGDLEGALEEYVAEEFGVTAEAVTRTGWNIRDHVSGDAAAAMRVADWAAQKVANAREKCAEVDAVADAQKAQIDRWCEAEKRKQEGAERFFCFVLQQYRDDFHADENSVALPCGVKLRMKKNRARIVWDDAAALGFARAQTLEGVIATTLKRAPLKQRLEQQDDGSFVYSGLNEDSGEYVEEVVEFVRMEQPDEERTFEVD